MNELLKAYWSANGHADIELGNILIHQHRGETVYGVKVMDGDTLHVRTQDLLVFLFERKA